MLAVVVCSLGRQDTLALKNMLSGVIQIELPIPALPFN